jgi:Fe-S-cluster containining protein
MANHDPQAKAEKLYQDQRSRVEEHIRKALEQERSAMTLIRLALAAHRSGQDTSQSFELTALSKLACREGCDYCCYPPVSAAVPEVANIVAYILSQLPKPEQQRLQAKVKEAYEQTKAMTSQQRTSTNLACPYLKEGKCSIYPVRPLACRGYNSISKSACQKVFEQPEKRHPVPAFVPMLASAQGLKEGMASGLSQAGLKTPLVDLTKASQKLLEDLDHNLERWLKGEDVFADCAPFGGT